MSDRDNEDDSGALSQTVFAVHMKQFSYTPPMKGEHLKTPSAHPPLVNAVSKVPGRIAMSEGAKTMSDRSKRKHDVDAEALAASASPATSKRRTTTKDRSANDPYEPENKLVDSLRPGLMLVFIGLNPGLETARTGHAYAHPTNQFWPLLHNSGITKFRHKASDTHLLPDLYNIGNTNLCVRATRSGDGLSKKEQAEGAKIVEDKISRYRPEAVCIVGKGIWDTIYKSKTGKTLKRQDFKYGWQDEIYWLGRSANEGHHAPWVGARTFVCTSTSGLAADTKPAEKLAIMSQLGAWVKERSKELADNLVERTKEQGTNERDKLGLQAGADVELRSS